MNPGSQSLAAAGGRVVAGLTPPQFHRGTKPRIGDVVVTLGFTDRATIDKAVQVSRETKRPTGQVLVEMGALDSRQLAHALADRERARLRRP